MSAFITNLEIRTADHTDDGLWIVAKTFFYQSDVAERLIMVPSGFQTDLNSNPFLDKLGKLGGHASVEGAAIHDWLYHSHETSKSLADRIFMEACILSGDGWWLAHKNWLGVALFGGSSWASGPSRGIIKQEQ